MSASPDRADHGAAAWIDGGRQGGCTTSSEPGRGEADRSSQVDQVDDQELEKEEVKWRRTT